MKNQLSDTEKALIGIWIALGGIAGALFAAGVMRQKPTIPGLIGLVIGAGIAFLYFRNPRLRRHRGHVDRSKWMGDEFSDIVIKRIFQVYNVRQEPGLEEKDEESEEELTEIQCDEPKSNLADEPPEGWIEPVTVFWDSLSITSKLLVYFSILWPVAFAVINYVFPKFIESMVSPQFVRVLFLLPTCILTGINGLFILFGQNTVNELEQKPKGFWAYIAALLALVFGCGVGAYLIGAYVLQMGL